MNRVENAVSLLHLIFLCYTHVNTAFHDEAAFKFIMTQYMQYTFNFIDCYIHDNDCY